MSKSIIIYVEGDALVVHKEIALIHEVTHGQNVTKEQGRIILQDNCKFGIMQCGMKLKKKKIRLSNKLMQE